MKKLEVGDKMYFRSQSRFGRDIYFRFETVERVTKTQAVLSNGIKLINHPFKNHFDNHYGFCQLGQRFDKWYIQTDEIVAEAQKENKRQSINRWFDNQKFTDEQKLQVHDLFNPIDSESSINEKK